jgi:hypothetical protein
LVVVLSIIQEDLNKIKRFGINIGVVRGIGVPNYSNATRSISMCIYFTPTYLYIKQHNVTGLKYFGKTTQKNPISYPGSGLHWKRHLKTHGNDVSTVWAQLFTSQEELTEYAVQFSKENQIVESREWANLRDENGLDGQPKGTIFGPMSESHKQLISSKLTGKEVSAATRKKMSDSAKGNKRHLGIMHSEESRKKMSDALQGRVHSSETKQKMSDSAKGNTRSLGHKHSEETKQRMRDAHAKRKAAKAANQ